MSAGYGAWGYGLSSETSQGPVALAPRPLQGSRAPFLNDSVRAATYNVPEAGFASRVGQRATGSTGLVDPFSYGFAQQGPDHGRSASGSFHHSSNTSQERHETLMPPLAGDYGQIGGASGGAGKPVMRSVAHSSSFGNPLLSPASLASASPTLSAVSLSPGLNPMRSGMLPSPGLGPSAVRGSSPNFGHVRSGSAASGSTLYGASLGASDRILPSPTLQAVSGSDHIQAHHFQQHHHPQRQTQMCKFYGSGNCKFGDGCRFIHPGPSTAHERLAAFVAASAREQANHGVMNGPSGMLARPAIGRLPQVALSESGPAPGQKTALINSSKGLQQIYFGRKIQKTCRFWMRGTCRFGDTCRYEHAYPQGSQHANHHQQYQPDPSRMSARDFLTAFAASRERPGMDAGTRAFVQALDEREKAELRMLLGMEEPQSSVAAQSNQPASRDSGSTASVEGASSAGRYDADETDTAVFQYAQYEELLRSASPQTRAQLLGAFDDEDEYDGNEHQHQLAPAYTDPGSGSAGRAQMGSVKVVGLAEDDLEDGLALPAARLAGISLSSDGGSDSSSPPAAFIDVAGDGLQDHPLIQAQDALRNGFGSVTTPFNSSPTSIGNFSAGAYTRHDSRHEKISSPEVRAIFGADVPEGAVSFGGGGFGGAPRIPSWKITGTQQTAPFMDGLDIAFAASAWIDNTKHDAR